MRTRWLTFHDRKWLNLKRPLTEARKEAPTSKVASKKKKRQSLPKAVKNCVNPWYYVRLLPDGSIKACNNHGFAIGNVTHQDINVILGSKKMRSIKRDMLFYPAKSCKSSCDVTIDYE